MKSFHKAFKDVYHTTPAEYRKQRDANIETKNLSKHEGTSYLSYDRDNAYVSLFKYLPSQANEPAAKLSEQSVMVKEYDIRLSGNGKPIKHTWKTLCTIGKAKEALYGPVQEHLKMIQEIVPFRYIRFHGIFDDEMMVYRKDAEGEPIFNFTYVDKVIDFLRSIGLRPFFELGFMPGELADKTKTIFYKTSYVSLPQNNEHWTSLLQSFIRHLASRYGAEEIKTWYFEFWNEPDVRLFWPYSFEEFTLFYRNSYRALKSVSPDLRIGGPSIVSDSLIKSDWIERYMTYCVQHDCRPDFITFHMYPLLLERGTLDNIDSPTGVQYAGEDYVKETIMKVKQTLRKWGAPGAELHVTEWNSTPHHRELTNDTCYKSAYIVKNIIENIDEVGSMGYWTVTDLLEELPLPAETFHGGLGLITNNGVKKPGFYAYELLAKLGDRLLDLGESYCLTMSQDGSYQLLLYHYCHFDQLYSMNDTSAIGSFNRYDVFTDSGQLNLTFRMDGIPAGNYEIRKYAINREHGSSYDLWMDMGHPEGMTPQDVQYLNMRSMPRQTVKQEAIGESFAIRSSLSPHEVQLIEIRPVY
ncbi:GH39 family glycosyl hydrolase [Paenibacillus prosopidis]|uniref:Xylan 1,4-beta-xylosidase n=1 Tax=Paenibacillus prosopidis TaxID=630520 RepID=A0A368W0L9_9BACL|nr:glycosyl hydrolase [Paenibacillus prosopidis]RCW48000.1 xylan 1,4-beta-xylosidase [Paenibacillus prosopidis]